MIALLLLSCTADPTAHAKRAAPADDSAPTATDTAPGTTDSEPATGDSDSPPDTDSDTAPIDTGTPCTPSLWYVDADADGYGSDVVGSCEQPAGTSATSGDCDDANASTHPGAADDVQDSIDNDCDGATDEDWDPCSTPYGYLEQESTSYSTGSASPVNYGRIGYAWVCSVACDVWWLTAKACSDDACTTELALPVLATQDTFRAFLTSIDPGPDGGVGTCTYRTSAGDAVYTLSFTPG